MRICFLHYKASPEIAEVMIASVREHMPNAIVTQLSDARSPKLKGSDDIRRVDGVFYPYILARHMTELRPPFIRVDYDMIFQGDITNILDEDIDMAMNLHGDPTVIESSWGRKYPYATCIWGAKNKSKEFAEDFRRTHIEAGRDEWLGLIPSVNEVVLSGKYRVKALPGNIYNYPPTSRDDRPKDALVLHYKGFRKKWMLPEGDEALVKRDENRLSQMVGDSDRRELFIPELQIHKESIG
jgi:hypothetical protein